VNSNLIHNVLNILIALTAAATAFFLATGCTTLVTTGALDCSASWIDPKWTTIAITVMGVAKVLINIGRDGLSGLTKPQPPVDKS
jgi:hypothetical protein